MITVTNGRSDGRRDGQ